MTLEEHSDSPTPWFVEARTPKLPGEFFASNYDTRVCLVFPPAQNGSIDCTAQRNRTKPHRLTD